MQYCSLQYWTLLLSLKENTKLQIQGTSLVVQWFKTLPSNAGGEGSIPGQEAKTPTCPVAKKKKHNQKQYFNKFNKDLKNGLHQKS